MINSVTIDRTKPVLVTGGSGYVGSWIVKLLIEQGVQVHTTVRDKTKPASTAHLHKIKNSDKLLKIFDADLLVSGSFADAMQGCEVVIHTASPFIFMSIDDPQSQLIDPAVQGTENVLNTANDTESVKRIVLTSSVAAMYGDNVDVNDFPNRVINEECWNTTSSLDHQPYSYSKLLAEKRAWELSKLQQNWQLVVINPAMIFGPSLADNTTSFSVDLLKQIGNGRFWPAAADMSIAAADVRDVANAHVLAAFAEKVEDRYLLAQSVTTFIDIAKALSNTYKRWFKFPFFVAPKAMVWLAAPLYDLTRAYVARNVGHDIAIDNARSLTLGLTYRPISETVIEHYGQLLEFNQV